MDLVFHLISQLFFPVLRTEKQFAQFSVTKIDFAFSLEIRGLSAQVDHGRRSC